MNKKLKILVAYNDTVNADAGNPDLISEAAVKDEANSVLKTIREMGHISSFLPVNDIGRNLRRINGFAPDLIFNLCEGFRGEAKYEMNIAGLWELLGISYTGNRAFTLGLAQNKFLSKMIFREAGIPTPDYQVFTEIPKTVKLKFPLIVKPVAEDASLGINPDSVVKNLKELRRKVSELLKKYRQPVLVEEYIHGREFNVSILGNNSPDILPISEIIFSDIGKEFPHIVSYEAKWFVEHPLYRKTPAMCPAKIARSLENKIKNAALKVYQVMMGRDYGRVDIRVDGNENIFVLEYNPNPDISPDAGFIKSLKAAGMDYNDFIKILIDENMKEKAG